MATIATYNELRDAFNSFAKNMKLPTTITAGEMVLVEHGPITISMNSDGTNVDKITIHSAKDEDPLWDEAFEGFEEGMHWTSMNFYQAYQNAIHTNQTSIGQAHGITATHTDPTPNDLTVVFERK